MLSISNNIGPPRVDSITDTIDKMGNEKFVTWEDPLALNAPVFNRELENEGIAHIL